MKGLQLILCACLLGMILSNYAHKELFKERNQLMNSFVTHDKAGNAVYLEWEKIPGQSPQLTQKIYSLSALLTQTYTQQELRFAHAHPEAIPQDYFLNPLAPLFQENKIDWSNVEHQTRAIFNHFFTQTPFAQFSPTDEVNYFVMAHDEHGKLLGFIQFLVNPEFAKGTVKAGMFAVAADGLQPELRRILMGSIFKIVPDAQRIIVHTRITNTDLLNLYSKWGFTHKIDGYWANSEYITENSNVLKTL